MGCMVCCRKRIPDDLRDTPKLGLSKGSKPPSDNKYNAYLDELSLANYEVFYKRAIDAALVTLTNDPAKEDGSDDESRPTQGG